MLRIPKQTPRYLLRAAAACALLLTVACNNDDDEFPREAFNDAFNASITQSYANAITLSAAMPVLQQGEGTLEDSLTALIETYPCAQVQSSDDMDSLSFPETCEFHGRTWLGSLTYETGSADVSIAFDGEIEGNETTFALTISPIPGESRHEVQVSSLVTANIIDQYSATLQVEESKITASDETEITGVRTAGESGWRSADDVPWSITMVETLTQLDRQVARSGGWEMQIGGEATFRLFFNATSADATGVLIRSGDTSLALCVAENDSTECE